MLAQGMLMVTSRQRENGGKIKMGNEYYGVATTPTTDYLAHYGVKGMKWGVRKALARGSDRALSRQYRKAQKKLAKLEKRAMSGKKYAKRAAALGAGAAAAGGLAAIGTAGAGRITNAVGQGMQTVGYGANRIAGKYIKDGKIRTALSTAGGAVGRAGQTVSGTQGKINAWGHGNNLAKGATHKYASAMAGAAPKNATQAMAYGQKYSKAYGKANKAIGGLSNDAIARIGAGAIGAGLGIGAGYNAYRAATTKRAAAKAAAFRKEMNKTFAGTRFANAPRTPQKRRRRG